MPGEISFSGQEGSSNETGRRAGAGVEGRFLLL